jgi:hypothetical protein
MKGHHAPLMKLKKSGSPEIFPLRSLFPYLVISILGLSVTGCAGFRGGWESVPYVGDPPSPESLAASQPVPRAGRRELNLPGVKLLVGIDNQLRTYDTQIILGLPLSIDPRNVYPKNHKPGRTRVFVTTVPETGGFVFRPSLALLVIDGKQYEAVRGFRFGEWDAQGRLSDNGGNWEHRDVGAELALTKPGARYLLSLEFDVPVPSPESRGILLDLSNALRDVKNFGDSPLPPIRFAPVRWKEGYT